MEEATHKISAVFFPACDEVELTWEDLITGESAHLTVKVSKEKGEEISAAVSPCVYHGATIKTTENEDDTRL